MSNPSQTYTRDQLRQRLAHERCSRRVAAVILWSCLWRAAVLLALPFGLVLGAWWLL